MKTLARRALTTLVTIVGAVAFVPVAAAEDDRPAPNTAPAVSQYVEQVPTAHGSSSSRTAKPKGTAPAGPKTASEATSEEAGLGRGAALALVLGGVTLAALGGIFWRRRNVAN